MKGENFVFSLPFGVGFFFGEVGVPIGIPMRSLGKTRAGPSEPRLAIESLSLPYRSWWPKFLLAGLILVTALLLAGSLGAVAIPFPTVVQILLSRLPGLPIDSDWPASWETIIWDIRLPRLLLAGLVGASLAMSGATYQGIFRNPLADPYLIGVAAGAGLGATIILVSPVEASAYRISVLPLAALCGALVAVTVAYFLARVGQTVPATTLILSGVAIAALASALSSFIMLTGRQDLRIVFSWIMGSFNTSSWEKMLMVVPYLIPSALVIFWHARVLNVLQLDEEQAQQLGINVERVKLLLIAAASLATAAAVSVSGLIGFVGLIVPHAVRLLWGPDFRLLLPLSFLLGGAFLVLADLLARTVVSPAELPVGIITAFCGAPFFLYLLRQRKRAVF